MELNKMNFVDEAERVMIELEKNNTVQRLTTTKIRNILTTASTIYDNAKRKQGPLTEDEVSDVQVLRMKLVYEYGRNEAGVRDFLDKSKLIERVKKIGNDRQKLIIFCKYLEALVAYHRYEGGKDF